MDSLPYYLGFSHFLGIGPHRFSAFINKFGDVETAYKSEKKDLVEIIGENLTEKFIRFRLEFDPIKKLEELKHKKITIVSLEHRSYPAQLKQISDPPICLYVRGDYNRMLKQVQHDNNKCHSEFISESPYFFAIVGTRKPTPYGEQIAKKFAYELAQAGFVIVSGMAMGIDAISHWGALEAGGKTIAVLGCGVDIIYPSINAGLYQQIIEKDGLIISEFPPGHTVLKGLFIARNRIISGLSMGVLVVEGAKDSGSLITARYAGEQGKEVFAPPGPLTSEMSAAPNLLLKQGAKLVTGIADILEEFNLKTTPKKKEEVAAELDGEERIIFEFLSSEPKLADEISQEKKLPIGKVLNTLSVLEIKGIIEKNSQRRYQVKI